MIDPAALRIGFTRARGPGGQNVNKLSTAVELRYDLASAGFLDPGARARAATLAGSRLTRNGVLVLFADRFRTQEANRRDALARLEALLEAARVRPERRVKTRPTLASKTRRLEAKRLGSARKQGRAPPVLSD